MPRQFTRAELYDLVWADPMRDVAKRLGLSDVGLRKICVRAQIPLPPQGHWNKLRAGKKSVRIALSPRGPGMSDEVTIGRSHYWSAPWTDEELLGPIPKPPTFPEPIESVRERVRKQIGRVTVPRDLSGAHPAITALLEEDNQRREKNAAHPLRAWRSEMPRFDPPTSRRPLRLMNALFLAVLRGGGKGAYYRRTSGYGEPEPDPAVTEMVVFVNDQRVDVRIAPATKTKAPRNKGEAPKQGRQDALRMSIVTSFSGGIERIGWSDGDQGRIESRMREIAIEVITTAEMQHREGEVRMHEWRIERKAEREEELLRQAAEAECKRREKEAAEAKARVERLLSEAAALRRANDIRAYVDAVCRATTGAQLGQGDMANWQRWALDQADSIDPVLSLSFLRDMT